MKFGIKQIRANLIFIQLCFQLAACRVLYRCKKNADSTRIATAASLTCVGLSFLEKISKVKRRTPSDGFVHELEYDVVSITYYLSCFFNIFQIQFRRSSALVILLFSLISFLCVREIFRQSAVRCKTFYIYTIYIFIYVSPVFSVLNCIYTCLFYEIRADWNGRVVATELLPGWQSSAGVSNRMCRNVCLDYGLHAHSAYVYWRMLINEKLILLGFVFRPLFDTCMDSTHSPHWKEKGPNIKFTAQKLLVFFVVVISSSLHRLKSTTLQIWPSRRWQRSRGDIACASIKVHALRVMDYIHAAHTHQNEWSSIYLYIRVYRYILVLFHLRGSTHHCFNSKHIYSIWTI